jgi:hypothetical protein
VELYKHTNYKEMTLLDTSHDIRNIRLTSAEIAHLWTTYMNDSASVCVFSYFVSKIQDPDIKLIAQYALNTSKKQLEMITDIFNKIKHPIPLGFTKQDVSLESKQLFSDTFILLYTKYMARLGLVNYGEALPMCPRSDVREFFTSSLGSSIELSNKCDDLLLSKGLYIRAPYIPVPEKVEFVHKQSFLNGFIGDKRPLSCLEISQLHINLQTNTLGKSFALGLSQVVNSDEVRKFLIRGKEIAEKHMEIFSNMLRDEELPAATTWDGDILDSTESPFSEKLIMFQFTVLNAIGMSSYGSALSKSMRSDIFATFTRLSGEIAKYSEDGANIMIKNGWLEKIPETVDRRELIGV